MNKGLSNDTHSLFLLEREQQNQCVVQGIESWNEWKTSLIFDIVSETETTERRARKKRGGI